jgi:hypothetical protein
MSSCSADPYECVWAVMSSQASLDLLLQLLTSDPSKQNAEQSAQVCTWKSNAMPLARQSLRQFMNIIKTSRKLSYWRRSLFNTAHPMTLLPQAIHSARFLAIYSMPWWDKVPVYQLIRIYWYAFPNSFRWLIACFMRVGGLSWRLTTCCECSNALDCCLETPLCARSL